VVTTPEHELLSRVRDVEGWARYRAAGVRVYDLAKDPPTLLADVEDLAPRVLPAPPAAPTPGAAQEASSGHLPLRAAYPFGAERGLGADMDRIRSLEIRWDSPYTSSVRRGYVVELFETRGIFDDFKARHWPYGNTPAGRSRVRRYVRIKSDFERAR
jgi:hypothetical protein